MSTRTFNISGANGQPIIGDTHLPAGEARGVIIIAHGFKGYKDYGMFPRVAKTFCDSGYIAHRFNFSHSGMTNNIDTFEKPELFARDTWNKQVDDLMAIIHAIDTEQLPGKNLPYLIFGHSRGGASTLLFAGRTARDDSIPKPAGIITAAAPACLNRLPPKQLERLVDEGYLESPSSRTRQRLRVEKIWLDEQLADPEGHELLAQIKNIVCPLLVIHGSDDPTVPCSDADEIANAARSETTVMKIEGGNHVFNVPNPFPENKPNSPQFDQLIDNAIEFANELT